MAKPLLSPTVLRNAYKDAFVNILRDNPGLGPRDKLKVVRQILGCSQKEFADLLGLSHMTVRNWESESRSEPSGAAEAIINMFALDPIKLREFLLEAKTKTQNAAGTMDPAGAIVLPSEMKEVV